MVTEWCMPATGERGAVSAAHPLGAAAGCAMFEMGGNAVDAAIAAQGIICVAMPYAAGLGGDMLALVASGADVLAVSGAGRTPARAPAQYATTGGSSITVPGLVDAWLVLHEQFGQLPLHVVLAPAEQLAADGFAVDPGLAHAVDAQRIRIIEGGGANWTLLNRRAGEKWRQPELSRLLRDIAIVGRAAFYSGEASQAIADAVCDHGGTLTTGDMAAHSTVLSPTLSTAWGDCVLHVQPSPSQGVLLAMAAQWLNDRDGLIHPCRDHVLVETTEAAFQHRDAASRGEALFDEVLDVDVEHSARRGGPRAYLHTAGVATADSTGLVVSSLVSVFDDFGSGVYVPELGIILNNRAGGFTSGLNAPGPSKRPVHTLAPALVQAPNGDCLALATPGADGQVQTLLQVLDRMRYRRESLNHALAASRWRSEDARLLVEDDHDDLGELTRRGHRTSPRKPGDDVFGAVVAAGTAAGGPFAASDWRRSVTTGAV